MKMMIIEQHDGDSGVILPRRLNFPAARAKIFSQVRKSVQPSPLNWILFRLLHFDILYT